MKLDALWKTQGMSKNIEKKCKLFLQVRLLFFFSFLGVVNMEIQC